jgi:hypothetical protein
MFNSWMISHIFFAGINNFLPDFCRFQSGHGEILAGWDPVAFIASYRNSDL